MSWDYKLKLLKVFNFKFHNVAQQIHKYINICQKGKVCIYLRADHGLPSPGRKSICESFAILILLLPLILLLNLSWMTVRTGRNIVLVSDLEGWLIWTPNGLSHLRPTLLHAQHSSSHSNNKTETVVQSFSSHPWIVGPYVSVRWQLT